jgi:hypothetical protein
MLDEGHRDCGRGGPDRERRGHGRRPERDSPWRQFESDSRTRGGPGQPAEPVLQWVLPVGEGWLSLVVLRGWVADG